MSTTNIRDQEIKRDYKYAIQQKKIIIRTLFMYG